jgi:hypothetical protein
MLVYSLLVYFPLVITRLPVCSFARLLGCSFARLLVYSCTPPRGAIHLLAFLQCRTAKGDNAFFSRTSHGNFIKFCQMTPANDRSPLPGCLSDSKFASARQIFRLGTRRATFGFHAFSTDSGRIAWIGQFDLSRVASHASHAAGWLRQG